MQIVADALGANADPVGGEEHKQGQRGRCRQVARWRMQSGNQARQVGGHEEKQQAADKWQDLARVLSGNLTDGRFDQADDALNGRLQGAGFHPQPPRETPGKDSNDRSQQPGRHDGTGDADWSQRDQRSNCHIARSHHHSLSRK